jgi:catechol 2,3-dioxygenase-like lactoylglutathione lyase family enzyme
MGLVPVVRLDHVQLAMPAGREAEAAAFYEGLLGIPQIPKPPHLARRGGCWFERGDLKIHLGVEQDFRPAAKAHPALIVDDVRALAAAIAAAGYAIVDDEPLDGYDRIYAYDPFGNRVELMEPLA